MFSMRTDGYLLISQYLLEMHIDHASNRLNYYANRFEIPMVHNVGMFLVEVMFCFCSLVRRIEGWGQAI